MFPPRSVVALWLTVVVVPATAARGASTEAQSSDAGVLPDAEALEQLGATIGAIVIRIGDVFDAADPAENKFLFRAANRLHIKTHEKVIRAQLLFESGDLFDARLLEESERLLRKNRYLYDAQIAPIDFHDGQVDIDVTVRDVWTLAAGLGFGRSGGENRKRIELEDSNIFGTGKDVTLQWKSDVDRDSFLTRYRDPQLVGRRAQLEAWYSDNSDGDLKRLDVIRPFYSVDARWTAGGRSLGEDRVDSLYSRGEITDQFRHRIRFLEAFGGRSPGLRDRRARRWTAGMTFEEHRFSEDGGIVPEDRTLVYPWIGLELVADDFIETRDYDRITRTEDLSLGLRVDARVGWSSTIFGADRDRAVFRSEARRGFRTGARHLLFLSVFGSGRHGSGGVEDLRSGGTAQFFLRNLGKHQFVSHLSFELAEALDREDQLLLGGDSGLRGYPLRYQDGDRRFLLTLEQRFYAGRQMFHIVYVGCAAFLDLGRAWFDAGNPPDDPGLLADAGVGLRLSSSRSGRGTMVHLDLAFPLVRDDTIRSVQWLVTTKETF